MIIRLYMIIHNHVYSIYIYIITPKLCQSAKNLVFRQASWVEFWMVHGSGKGTMFSSAPSRRTRWHGYQASTIHPATSWRWRKPETKKPSTFLGCSPKWWGNWQRFVLGLKTASKIGENDQTWSKSTFFEADSLRISIFLEGKMHSGVTWTHEWASFMWGSGAACLLPDMLTLAIWRNR